MTSHRALRTNNNNHRRDNNRAKTPWNPILRRWWTCMLSRPLRRLHSGLSISMIDDHRPHDDAPEVGHRRCLLDHSIKRSRRAFAFFVDFENEIFVMTFVRNASHIRRKFLNTKPWHWPRQSSGRFDLRKSTSYSTRLFFFFSSSRAFRKLLNYALDFIVVHVSFSLNFQEI